jgi:hypothetical protein
MVQIYALLLHIPCLALVDWHTIRVPENRYTTLVTNAEAYR